MQTNSYAQLGAWTSSSGTEGLLGTQYANIIIFSAAAFALLWGFISYRLVAGVDMKAESIQVNVLTEEEIGEKEAKGEQIPPQSQEGCFNLMLKIADTVKEGADEFLKKEYAYLALFELAFGLLIYAAVDVPTSYKPYTTVAFFVGALTSMLCGLIGMRTAVFSNVRVTYSCNESIEKGFHVAFNGGMVLGFCLVGLAILILQTLILAYKSMLLTEESDAAAVRELFEVVAGYGLGGSTVALFGRVGGGIYTKAADVGADLAGKVCEGLEEDSPDNPGTIADLVGDNVGDIAGMGADLFGSLAESICAALVVSAESTEIINSSDAAYFPLIITAVGILASFISALLIRVGSVTRDNIETKLKLQLLISTIVMSLCLVPALGVMPDSATIDFAGKSYEVSPYNLYACIASGLWSGLLIGYITEYFTSNQYSPVINLAESCRMGAAPNIILGLALGYASTIIPILCLAITIWLSFSQAGMYGVALAALGMLGCLPTALAIDGYGPIADNAGGISEMSNLNTNVREATDKLDAAGNTTAAIGKGFAIGSACLVSLALFGAYIVRVEEASGTSDFVVNVLDPLTFAGIIVGAMIPYAFSALTMAAVGDAANEMIVEIK